MSSDPFSSTNGADMPREGMRAVIRRATSALRGKPNTKLQVDTFELCHHAERLRAKTKAPEDTLLALTAWLIHGLCGASSKDVSWGGVVRRFTPPGNAGSYTPTPQAKRMYALLLMNTGIAATLKGGAEATATASAGSALKLFANLRDPSLKRWQGTALLVQAANEPRASERKLLAIRALQLTNRNISRELLVYAQGAAEVGDGLIVVQRRVGSRIRPAALGPSDLYHFND